MRFLADAGVSPKTIEFLKQFGHEATHVRNLGLQRAPDAELVHRARTDHSIIITFDLDFGDILALGVLDKPSVIIFRLADERVDSVHQRLAVVLTERHVDLEAGALILVEDTRYRVRKAPNPGRTSSPPLSTTPGWSPRTRGSTPPTALAEQRDVARRDRRRMRFASAISLIRRG